MYSPVIPKSKLSPVERSRVLNDKTPSYGPAFLPTETHKNSIKIIGNDKFSTFLSNAIYHFSKCSKPDLLSTTLSLLLPLSFSQSTAVCFLYRKWDIQSTNSSSLISVSWLIFNQKANCLGWSVVFLWPNILLKCLFLALKLLLIAKLHLVVVLYTYKNDYKPQQVTGFSYLSYVINLPLKMTTKSRHRVKISRIEATVLSQVPKRHKCPPPPVQIV